MKVVIQRVTHASVTIEKVLKSSIEKGMLILLGVADNDSEEDADWLVKKIAALRIFDDADGVMNVSVKDIDGEVLVVSQFTLLASTKKEPAPYISMRPSPIFPFRCMNTSAQNCPMKSGKK